MHVQILEIDKRLRAQCVANAPHSWAMLMKAAGWAEPAKRPECEEASYSGLGAIPLPSNWIDGRRVRAAEKAPQRKRPCRSRATARRSLLRHACVKRCKGQPESVRCGRK